MNILVTGGAGFIGSHFIRFILNTYPKYKVRNLDALTYAGNVNNLLDVAGNPRYQFIEGNICDAMVVESAMQGCDAVVHFAAETHVDRSIHGDPFLFTKTNVLGTHVLLETARTLGGIRFHHVSTDEVFGSLASDAFFTESSPYDPRSPYSASKAGSDHLVSAYHVTFGLPTTLSHASNNYGTYQMPEKFIPLAITNLLEGDKIPLYGDGLNMRDWLHVSDHCHAIDLILHHGKMGEKYMIGAGNEMTNKQMVEYILKFTGKTWEDVRFVQDRPGHDRRYAFKSEKMKSTLGFVPQIPLEKGLQDMVAWYQTHEDWWKPLKKRASVSRI